jgi:hypothetical protein
MAIDKIQAKIDGLRAFESSAQALLLDRLIQLESEVIDLNAEEQLFERGINAEGEEIIRYAPYSEVTIEIKRAQGQPVDRVTLRDTGDFHSEFFLTRLADGVLIDSADEKTTDLQRQYGQSILGLTDENIQYLILTELLPFLILRLRALIDV